MSAPTVLVTPVLVLNGSWLAIRTVTVRRALQLAANGAARIVHPESFEVHCFDAWIDMAAAPDEPCIRTVSLRIKPPEVIVLSHYEGMPAKSAAFSRRNLFRRDRHTCQYCGARPHPSQLTIDHVVPRSKGGATSWENCALACVRCNRRKRNRLPSEVGMKLMHTPARPAWTPLLEVPPGHVRASWQRFLRREHVEEGGLMQREAS